MLACPRAIWQHRRRSRGPLMHWILFAVAVAGFAGAVFAPSQGVLVLTMIIGFCAFFGGFIAMVAARIADRSRPDSTLLTDADVNALRKSVREARAAREAARQAQPKDPGD